MKTRVGIGEKMKFDRFGEGGEMENCGERNQEIENHQRAKRLEEAGRQFFEACEKKRPRGREEGREGAPTDFLSGWALLAALAAYGTAIGALLVFSLWLYPMIEKTQDQRLYGSAALEKVEFLKSQAQECFASGDCLDTMGVGIEKRATIFMEKTERLSAKSSCLVSECEIKRPGRSSVFAQILTNGSVAAWVVENDTKKVLQFEPEGLPGALKWRARRYETN